MMRGAPIRIALVGIGKIARDQHVPTIASRKDIDLVAAVSRNSTLEGVETFTSMDEAFRCRPDIEAVVLCTPPVGRHAQAAEALAAGRHVFLEKPPSASLAEIEQLRAQAHKAGLTLYASWHSRHAAAVEPARQWLADKALRRVHIAWKEDVRRWHPGQDWLFAPGGMGTFDPGINALSIVTHILPRPFMLREAKLHVPENRQTPVRAELRFVDDQNVPTTADFDILHAGSECWDIDIETEVGPLQMARGGASLKIHGVDVPLAPKSEYAGLYDHFVRLIHSRASEVDTAPFLHVADALMLGERHIVEPFSW